MPYSRPQDSTATQREPFHRWFGEHAGATAYRVKEVPLDQLDGWLTDPATGNLVHHTGRFYRVEGLTVTVRDDDAPGHTADGLPAERSWAQPIIVQPEIGILGILVKRFDGVPHLLMQAKMEPGNINTLQLSPTVQATRSNYTRVHRGKAVPYLEYFTEPGRGLPLADALQSEQGSWFLGKRNRNVVVETQEDVPVREGFRWFSPEEMRSLLRLDNVVNMDSRTVLAACFPAPADGPEAGEDSFRGALARSLAEPDRTTALLSRLTRIKSARSMTRRRIPLAEVPDWTRERDRIDRLDGRYFSVLGVQVEAGDREVPHWSQPLLKPAGRGVIAVVTRRVDGVLWLLMRACTQAGTFDVAEVGPTVQCLPRNHTDASPPFLDLVLSAPPERIRFDTVHSEEGGRFYHAENRYLVVEAGDDVPLEAPDGYLWATARDLTELVRHSHYLNVEARCLLTCLLSLR
ncbi:NDP-hexose 2,3-dehydratase [Streptomyces viridochromogenes]|uniref:NDP-hexose 2,3-dehydratase n=1 Tax=Streptomyces viridochromogenes TaxID=1938 RepID=A0A0J7ZMQ4_STRVR|nr:NDP-hexose 2,3-dehydratase family protein [Streptomyces viridochromogenes]KMS77311.1 NDP-hexose 2,3-dehydratase [Streptomyces viridochromogenes]KOG19034.1 NDP-hexose 2,3-dehydratase [Streptomyces viridochromogenes]KOG19273.1 NDP-hexose 2,3-dehydratase [Streptomyces viridochromogenes]